MAAKKKAAKKPRRKPRQPTTQSAAAVQLAPPPPQGGAQLPLGAHPGNTGGKKGRSGRKPDAFVQAMQDALDEDGAPFIAGVIRGEHMPELEDRMKAVDLAAKYTVGREKVTVIRIDSDDVNVERAFRLVAESIRKHVGPALFARISREIADQWAKALPIPKPSEDE